MSEQKLFEHPSGRKAEVIVSEGKLIGSGSFGDAYEVIVQMGGKTLPMVLKKFRENEAGSPAENAERAFENYKKAQVAGLKVFPTYRISEDHQGILMTDGRKNNIFCAAGNNTIQTAEKIRSIQNIEALTHALMEQASIAARNGIALHADSPFFMIPSGAPETVDFYIGDLDVVDKSLLQNRANSEIASLYSVRNALLSFIETYVENPATYQKDIKSLFDKEIAISSYND